MFDSVRLFQHYDLTSEIMLLGVAILMLFLIHFTSPKRSRMFYLNFWSFITAIATIMVHIILLNYTCYPETFSPTIFSVLYSVYVLLYITILNEITTYIDLLSYKRRNRIHITVIKVAILSSIYLLMNFYPVFMNGIYLVGDDGSISLTQATYTVEISGIICGVTAFFSCLARLKSLSKLCAVGTMFFIPLNVMVLIAQFGFGTAYFLSFTYVIPFTIFYCLFHANIYDDIIGCQKNEALVPMIKFAQHLKKNFVVITVQFPQAKNREYSDITKVLEDGSSLICRKIERLKMTAKVFSTDLFTYSFFSFVKDEEDADKVASQIREIIDRTTIYANLSFSLVYKQAVIYCNPIIKKPEDYIRLAGFLKRKFNNDLETQYYKAVQSDYESFLFKNKIENAVLNIRAKNDLNDERVLCFIQPIHSIQLNSFRTGESLMRLKLEDKVIYPDSFIEVAEKNNCIHTLTMIMINKICLLIKELEEEKIDFEAITVNCSTIELADRKFHEEVCGIVEKIGIAPNHLRLEITESTEVQNYDNILYNMNCLTARQIGFYLDDFGTGYSNLERIANYPFKTIKFDKSILYSALSNKKADALIRMQVNFFSSNGFKTVVEGVEDEEQYNYCKDVGFGMIQGYYFSKPKPAEEIRNYFCR